MMKAQSAMEYLMTYGWAILIIAVVLGALFTLGVFNASNLLGISCVASPGYLCSTAALQTNGQLSFTFGQNTGITIYNIEMACAASSSSGLPANSASWSLIQMSGIATNTINNANLNNAIDMPSASTISVNQLVCYSLTGLPLASQPVGSGFSGYIWLNYTLNACNLLPCNSVTGTQWYTVKALTLSTKSV